MATLDRISISPLKTFSFFLFAYLDCNYSSVVGGREQKHKKVKVPKAISKYLLVMKNWRLETFLFNSY